jgi:3-oxoacyl-[acyl-carrier protein] reductase
MQRILRDGAFRGETHIVTGAAQGIGLAVATALAVHGAQVVMVDLGAEALAKSAEGVVKESGVKPIVAPADVANEAQVQKVVADALAATGAIHGVVNVAGVTRDVRLVKKSFDEFKFVVGVHLHGTFLFMREVAVQHWHALFKERGNEPLSDGVNRYVVNFSSVSARNGNIGQVDYTAAKGAIEGITKTTAREFAAYGARVNAIAPGPVDTPMLAKVDDAGRERMKRTVVLGRLAQPSEMASAVVALADPKLLGYCTGQILPINGGMYMA